MHSPVQRQWKRGYSWCTTTPGVEELPGFRGLTWHLADRFNCIVTQVRVTGCLLWLRVLSGRQRCIVKLEKFMCTEENQPSVEMLCTCFSSQHA